MFKCILVICFVSLTCAHRPGYSYQQQQGRSHFGSAHVNTLSPGRVTATQQIRQHIGQLNAQAHTNTPASAAPQYQKSYYFFSAPEEDTAQNAALQRALQTVKKNVRVIFIKAPENRDYEKAVLSLLKNAAEQKTHIYLLNKQPNYEELARKFQAAQQSQQHQPEVHFVKYRTPEDARNAQLAIKQQYESGAGGSVVDHNSVQASVLNFANSGRKSAGAPVAAAPAASATNVGAQYETPTIGQSNPVDKNYARNFLPSGIDVKPGTSYIPLALRS